MKVKLALISSPVSIAERYGSFAGAASTQPCFGLACLAAVAHAEGATTSLIDASAEGLSMDQTLSEILAFNPDILGITATTMSIVSAGTIAERIKQARPETLVIIGGCHASALPEETLREFRGIDIAVIGEGEMTLSAILQHSTGGDAPPLGIDGTAEWRDEKIVINPPRVPVENLDGLPMPAWHLIRGFPTAYKPSPARIRRWPCASIVLTRGCPNQCTFCDRSVFGRKCRAYSPDYAVRMIKELSDDFGVKEICIEDDTFTVSNRRVKEFCEQLIAGNIEISWSCLGRADTASPEIFSLMRKAGCWHISFGIESGSPEILKNVHKNLDIDQIRHAVSAAREAGLQTKGFFMVGFPGETPSTIDETSRLATSLPLDDISVMQLTPFPGSELYKEAEKYGSFENNWRRMNTINTVFVPHGLTKQDMERARSDIIRRFYMRPSVMYRQFITAVKNPRTIGFKISGLSALIRNISR